MPIEIPILTPRQIEAAALKCLAETHPDGTIPVPIEEIVDVGYRIDLVPTANLEANFLTVAFITHDLTEIRVDDFVYRKQPYRLRFSLAHELGHLILHRSVYKQLNFTTPDGWKMAMDALGQSSYQRLESQADRFAGVLLIPPNHLRNQFSRITTALSQAGKVFKYLTDDAQNYAVMGLAKTFNVSTGAIWFRLRDGGLI